MESKVRQSIRPGMKSLALPILVSTSLHLASFGLPLINVSSIITGESANGQTHKNLSILQVSLPSSRSQLEAYQPLLIAENSAGTLPDVKADASAKKGGLFLAQSQHFVPNHLVGTPAEPVAPVILENPAGSLLSKAGTVQLHVFVNSEGSVERVEVINADVPDDYAKFARNSFENARFRPGKIGDTTVNVRMKIEVTYEPAQPRKLSIPGASN